MRRCVIVGGAEIRTYDRVRQYFRPDDFFIYCDCGLRRQRALGAEPDLIVGDFDSHEKPETDRETIVLPVKKDDTDTVFAAKEAMRRGFDEFLLVGVSGGRLDHTLVNVYLLVMLREQGKRGEKRFDYFMPQQRVAYGGGVARDFIRAEEQRLSFRADRRAYLP